MIWLNPRTLVAHRDPGCIRKIKGEQAGGEFQVLERLPLVARPCSYCHSVAGYRRYPAR